MRFVLPTIFILYAGTFVAGLFGEYWWGFDLFSHFKFQHLWIGFLLMPLFTWRNHLLMTTLIMIVVLVNGGLLSKVLLSSPSAIIKPDQTVRIMYGNIKYDQVDVTQTAKSINLASPDVVILTEIQPEDLDRLLPLVSQFRFVTQMPALGAFDIAVLSKNELEEEPEFIFQHHTIPYLHAKVPTNNGVLSVFGVHPAPPLGGQSDVFLDEYNQYILENPSLRSSTYMIKKAASQMVGAVHTDLRDEYIHDVFQMASLNTPSMIIGDLNITSFSPKFRHWKDEFNMIDTQDEYGLQPTWPTWLPAFMRIPLDHVLVSENVILYNRWLGADTGSDHMPVVVDVEVY